MAELRSFARRDHRKAVVLAVLLGHGALLGLLAHDAGQRSAARWWLAPSQAAAPSMPSPPLVVRLLPLPNDPAPQATAQGRTSRPVPTPMARAPEIQPPTQQIQPEARVVLGAPAAQQPTATAAAASPGVRIDDQTLRQAAADAEAGTVRALAKAAGRLDDLERPRTPPLVVAMGGAAPPSLQEQIQARIAKDNACKQELGKSGVGERNVYNNRDTFMPSYIGAARMQKVGPAPRCADNRPICAFHSPKCRGPATISSCWTRPGPPGPDCGPLPFPRRPPLGVGADQILTVRPSPAAGIDFEYVIHNADGAEVEQCGNGSRCFARYVRDRGLTAKDVIRVQTMKGVIEPRLLPDGPRHRGHGGAGV